jgi:iron complex transport system substrate-binding protein
MRLLAVVVAVIVSGAPVFVAQTFRSALSDVDALGRANALRYEIAEVLRYSGRAKALRYEIPEALRYEIPQPAQAPARIISIIPAVTEMLFAIGAGPQVVAVGSFDRFPPDVGKLPRVGALIDPDVERILSLRPDLVVIYGSQTDLRTQLERAKIPIYIYSHAGLADITVTIRALGARVGREPAAGAFATAMEARIAAIRTRVAGRRRPRTLIVFERESLALRGIYASGGIGFIHDMVEAAGGTNLFADVERQAVQATTELILARRPDVILDLRGEEMAPETKRRETAVWQALPAVPAVRSGRVHVIADQRTVVPGPRVAEAIELFARTLHPEAFK